MMRDDDPFDEAMADPLPVRKETGPVLFLSLFLLLLAFFILLNSISTLRETRSRDVLSSLAATFQADTVPTRKSEIVVSTLGPVPEPEDVINELERLWISDVPFAKVEKMTEGRHMLVEMPTTQLFVGAEAEVRGDRRALIQATAHTLSARIPGQAVKMQGILFVERMEDVPLEPPSPDSFTPVQEVIDIDDPSATLVTRATGSVEVGGLAASRAGVLSRVLIAGGVPPSGIEIGVREGNESRVRFRFYFQDAERASMTFSDDVSQ
jgi:hypothetical protein